MKPALRNDTVPGDPKPTLPTLPYIFPSSQHANIQLLPTHLHIHPPAYAMQSNVFCFFKCKNVHLKCATGLTVASGSVDSSTASSSAPPEPLTLDNANDSLLALGNSSRGTEHTNIRQNKKKKKTHAKQMQVWADNE